MVCHVCQGVAPSPHILNDKLWQEVPLLLTDGGGVLVEVEDDDGIETRGAGGDLRSPTEWSSGGAYSNAGAPSLKGVMRAGARGGGSR